MAETATAETTDTTSTTAASTGPTTTSTADWRAGWDDTLKADPSLKDFKDSASLAKSYVSTKKMVGERPASISYPGADAKPEAVKAYREAIGVPEDAAKYAEGLKMPEGMDAKLWESAVSLAHSAHLPPAVAQKVVDAWTQTEQDFLQARRREWVGDLTKLRDQWGEMKFNRAATLATRVVSSYFPKEFSAFLDATGLGDHPLIFEGLAKIGEQFAEDGLVDGTVTGIPSAEDAKAEIAQLREQEYKNGPNHPDNERIAKRRMELLRRLPGGTTVVSTLGA